MRKLAGLAALAPVLAIALVACGGASVSPEVQAFMDDRTQS